MQPASAVMIEAVLKSVSKARQYEILSVSVLHRGRRTNRHSTTDSLQSVTMGTMNFAQLLQPPLRMRGESII